MTADFMTLAQNVSSSGAFSLLDCRFPEGGELRMEMNIFVGRLAEFIGANRIAQVLSDGRVVRSNDSGVTVRFSGGYKSVSDTVA
jgi:hypothetical protein